MFSQNPPLLFPAAAVDSPCLSFDINNSELSCMLGYDGAVKHECDACSLRKYSKESFLQTCASFYTNCLHRELLDIMSKSRLRPYYYSISAATNNEVIPCLYMFVFAFLSAQVETIIRTTCLTPSRLHETMCLSFCRTVSSRSKEKLMLHACSYSSPDSPIKYIRLFLPSVHSLGVAGEKSSTSLSATSSE